VAPHLSLYIVLSPFQDVDRFAIEIAWDEGGDFPWQSIGDKLNVESPRWRDRLGRLWSPHGVEPLWDLAPEETLATAARFEARQKGEAASYPPPLPVEVVISRIPSAIDDCLIKITQYAIPLFKEVAKLRDCFNIM
jgi:hypothetical protein